MNQATTATTSPSLGRSATEPLVPKHVWPWLVAISVSFIAWHVVIIEQTLRSASNLQLPESVGTLGDHALPMRWFLIFRHGIFNLSAWDPNWSHIMFVPFVSAYFVSQKKADIQATPTKVWWPGLVVMLLGMLSYAAAIYPIRVDLLRGYSMVGTLFGMVLFAMGPKQMRHLWFPIFFLVFAIKIPDRAWSLIASQLQGVVSGGGHFVLDLLSKPLNFSVGLHGHTLEVTPTTGGVAQKLNVAEACSGMRSLMTFTVLGTALAFLGTRPIWQRVILLASILPVALVMNICRITTLGLLTAYGKHDLAHGDFHTMIGLLMLAPAAGTFVLIGWVLNQLLVDDDDSQANTKETPKQRTPVKLKTKSTSPSKPTVTFKKAGIGTLIGICLSISALVLYVGNLAVYQPKAISESLNQIGAIAILIAAAGMVFTCLFGARKYCFSPDKDIALPACLLIASLGTGALAQNQVLQLTQAILIKNAVPLRKPLDQMATDFGSWTLIQKEPRLSSEIEEELGTTNYATFVFEDLNWPSNRPGSRIRLHVPYYTGTIDTVPHVPDRCFVAGGATDRELHFPQLKLDTKRYQINKDGTFNATTNTLKEVNLPGDTIEVTQFQYNTPGRKYAENTPSTVFYFFITNGKWMATPEQVRLQGFNPKDKYAYFAKIEIQPLDGINEQGQLATLDAKNARQRAEAFLSLALPEIMACLPDWQEVESGEWPPRDR